MKQGPTDFTRERQDGELNTPIRHAKAPIYRPNDQINLVSDLNEVPCLSIHHGLN